MNLDLAARDGVTLFGGGVVGCGWFLWFSRKLVFSSFIRSNFQEYEPGSVVLSFGME